jgi:hypothetical protein
MRHNEAGETVLCNPGSEASAVAAPGTRSHSLETGATDITEGKHSREPSVYFLFKIVFMALHRPEYEVFAPGKPLPEIS